MRRTEMIAVLVFFLLGVHVVQQASLLPYFDDYGPGPGFLPYWLGWFWIGLAILHFANLAIQPWLYPGKHPLPTGGAALRVAAVFAILLAAVFLMGSLGVLIMLVAMVLTLLRGIERMAWRVSAPVAIAISAAFYLIFAVALGVPLPKGPLGI
jgi:putative tricarboxylic transport membrane protein